MAFILSSSDIRMQGQKRGVFAFAFVEQADLTGK
jgi:hypothetical protein